VDVRRLKVLLVSYTHKVGGQATYIAGPPQDCAKYLRERVAKLTFIEQPSPISDDLTLTATVWEHGVQIRIVRCPWGWPRPLEGRNIEERAPWYYLGFKLREVAGTLYLLWKTSDCYDLYIGVEAINTVLGIWLRLWGRVRSVVYDVIDYSPQRFVSPVLNTVFHGLDSWCAAHANYCWNQTALIGQDRARRNPRVAARQLVKPSGMPAARIQQRSNDQVTRTDLIYVGTLQARDGVWVMLEALPIILRAVPAATLRIIGNGNEEAAMKHWLADRGLIAHVKFLGMIGDPEAVESWVAKSGVALAPYRDDPGSVKRYNDPSKPKLYLACGVPVVITQVPPVAEEIQRDGAGVAVAGDPEAFAQGVLRLLTDQPFYQACRHGATRLAARYTWERIFDDLFAQMEAVVTHG